jgi:GGDEF domain-containing protein
MMGAGRRSAATTGAGMDERYQDGIPRETRKTGFLQSFDRQKLDTADPADFSSKLLSFVRTNKVAADALIAGNVQMLGFEALKERFGDHWHGIKDKVHLLTEGVIKKHISADDVFCLMNDEKFIVLFGKASKADASKTAVAIGKEVNAKLSGAGAGGDAISVRPMVFEVPREDPAALRSPAAMEETVEEAQKRAQAAEAAAVEAAKDQMKMRFWPVANVRKRLISCYHADLHVPAGVELGFDPEEPSDTGSVEATIDRMVLQKAGAGLVEAGSHRWRALLIVPVHYETLAAKGYRTQYIEVCKLLPRIAEKRLFLLVKGMDDDVPQGRLHTLFSYLAPFVAGFIGDFSLAFHRAEKLGGVRMVGIGVNGHAITTPSAKDFVALKNFAAANKEIRMRRYFYGAATVEAATAARKARFDYVQGTGVAPAMPIPGKVFRI